MSSFLGNLLASVGTSLLSAAGKAPNNSIEAEAITELEKAEIAVADYEAGHAVVLGTFKEGGQSGKLYAIADNSPLVPGLAGRTDIPLS